MTLPGRLARLRHGLLHARAKIPVNESFETFRFAHAGLHFRLLRCEQLGLLQARLHPFPLPVQIALHVGVCDGGAILARLDRVAIRPLATPIVGPSAIVASSSRSSAASLDLSSVFATTSTHRRCARCDLWRVCS